MSPQDMVKEFHSTYGQAIGDRPHWPDHKLLRMRLDLITEECSELMEAVADMNMVEVADALADLIYVTYGMAITMGIDLDHILEEVHRSNMSKLGEDGQPIRRDDGKILKGPDFFPPDISKALSTQKNPL
jgi:predicted HAD superfamily Cof-like phosphohydrolase